MNICIVVAMASNKVIGKDGKLPWHIPEDLKYFRNLTKGHPVIMGRKTFESILSRLGGHPLSDRTNIVLSRYHDLNHWGKNVITASSFEDALDKASKAPKISDKVFVIGGESVYYQALPFATRMYITMLFRHFDGDAFFPEIDSTWGSPNIINDEAHDSDDKIRYTFLEYSRHPEKAYPIKKVVDPTNARDEEYKEVITKIMAEGKCPFCPENFKYHKEPILREMGDWFLTKASWPYENAEHHFLIIGKKHKENLDALFSFDMYVVLALAKHAVQDFKLEGGALTLRFGDTEYTGATVCHLHFHLIIPQKGKTVNFPIG